MDLVVVFVAALAFYTSTLAPTLIWGDSAWLTMFAGFGKTSFGSAGDHPLYLSVGRLFLWLPGEPARNLAWESAVFGALGVALVFRISRQLGVSRVAAAIGACALCVSHGFWMHAVIAEVYTANACFLLLTVTLAIQWSLTGRWRYLGASLVAFAVGLTNHLVLVGLLPALVAFVAVSRPSIFLTRRSVLVLIVALGVLAGIVVMVPWAAGAAHRIWVGPPGVSDYFRLSVAIGPMLREAGRYLMYLAYQFPSLVLLLGLTGIPVLARNHPRVAVLLLGAVVVNAGVFIHHTAWQSAAKFVFYISDYAIFAVLCAVAADAVLRHLTDRPRVRRLAAWAMVGMAVFVPPVIYAAVPRMARTAGIEVVKTRTLPYRDNQEFFLNPNKRGYDGARRFGEEALRIPPLGAVIFADYTPFSVLRYLQLVEHVRPDLVLRPEVDGRVRVVWESVAGRRRSTYLAAMTPDYDLTGLTGQFDLVPAGPIIEVRPRE